MEGGPDFELLKDAYAIIDGIPETAIALDRLQTAKGESLDKGTICSPAGWLAQQPKFRELGLWLSEDGTQLVLNGEESDKESPAPIMARLFSLEQSDADRLFADRYTYTLGDDSGLSDKRLWLREVREFLKEHGQAAEDFENVWKPQAR